MTPSDNRSFETRGFSSPNLLPEEKQHKSEPAPRKAPNRRIRFFSCFFIVAALLLTGLTAIIAQSNNDFFVGVKNGFLLRQLTHIFTGDENELAGEKEDRINFLLLGIGGPGHEGPYLTDTIILASFQPSTKKAAMLSIPRDLIIPDDDNRFIKVNHIYALSQQYGLDVAFNRTKELIGNAFDLPIHYLGVVDFQGFIEVIDTVNGVDVDVERAFTDSQFPAGINNYQNVSFDAGPQTMDGLTALRYARSRHGNNGEGSDFARSKRQQKIILSTKEKLASYNTFLNPKKITTLFGLLNEYTKTDIEPWEMVKLVQMGKDVNTKSMFTSVLDDSPNGFLYSGISSVDGAYILQPRSGDFSELQLLAHNMLEGSPFIEEQPILLIQNGTTIPSLAGNIAAGLEQIGLSPLGTYNAERQNYISSVLYDYTDGKKPLTKDVLESRFDIAAQSNIPLELLSYTVAKTLDLKDENDQYVELDFLLILGEDIDSHIQDELIRTLTPEELFATSTATSTDELLEDEEETE